MSTFSFIKSIALGFLLVSGVLATGPAPVSLGTAANYVILAKSGVSTVPTSDITGNVGLSPAASTFLTGFSLTQLGIFATSTQVSGFLYAANYISPTPSNLGIAVGDMQAAFTDASSRINPTSINLGAGSIGGLTFLPGLYRWTDGVSIGSDITISGTPLDTWIFQIPGTLTTSSAVKIILSGGALAKNIVWAVSGAVTVGTTSHFEGIILAATSITLNTGASANGRLLSQTAVNVQSVVLVQK